MTEEIENDPDVQPTDAVQNQEQEMAEEDESVVPADVLESLGE